MTEQQTLVLIKPDGLVKSLTGNIISKLSETELRIVGAKIVSVNKELAEEHYRHLSKEPFFDELIKYLQGHYHTRRVMAMVYHGDNAVEKVRRIVGSTDPEKADPISIRGKYGRITTTGFYENAVHASEDEKEAEREIKLWFNPDELTEKIYPVEKKESTREFLEWK
jgi:nucleoside-diphosphate kinase